MRRIVVDTVMHGCRSLLSLQAPLHCYLMPDGGKDVIIW